MKDTLFTLGCVIGLLAGSGHAVEADGVVSDAIVSPGPVATVASPAQALDETARTALLELQAEREAFVQSFDWDAGTNKQELQQSYTGAMDAFDLRMLELKRDAYARLGLSDLLERTERAIANRDTSLRGGHEDLPLERNASDNSEVEATR